MTTTSQLTAETITDDRIRQLKGEARQATDELQVALCDLALHDDSADMSAVPEIDDSLRSKLERLGVIPEHVDCTERARQLCADAINAALAQADVQEAR